jgi:formylglycine-generating enzyme required for sulfatase activity
MVMTPAFFIARHEVTIGQYKACVNEGACMPGTAAALKGADNRPVANVTWREALAYCAWLERKLKSSTTDIPRGLVDALAGARGNAPWHVTLPSEAEWEKAARGTTDRRIYPWGDQIDPTRANYRDAHIFEPAAAASYPTGASPYGLLNMAGNVWEWTRNRAAFYPYRPDDGREDVRATGDTARMVRGGSFNDTTAFVRVSGRYSADSGSHFDMVGFRVVVSPFQP